MDVIIIMLILLLLTIGNADLLKYTDKDTGAEFNWRALQKPTEQPWKIDNSLEIFIQTQYLFNFGNNLPNMCGGQSASAMELIEVLDDLFMTCNILGRHEMASVSLLNSQDPSTGIELRYSGGDRCLNNNGKYEIRFRFYCAKIEGDWEVVNDPDLDFCHIVLGKNTKAGCPVNFAAASYRSFYLVIGGVVLYLGIGFLLNVRNGYSGLEAVPHSEAFAWVVRKAKERFSGGGTGEKTSNKGEYEEF